MSATLKHTGIQFISGPHTADDRHIFLLCLPSQVRSLPSPYLQHRRHNHTLQMRNSSAFSGRKKHLWIVTFAFGLISRIRSLHHFCLIFSNSLSCRNDLTVQVRQTYFIIIDQIKCTYAASHQCLADVTAHATDSKYRNSGIRQSCPLLLFQVIIRFSKIVSASSYLLLLPYETCLTDFIAIIEHAL